MSVLVIGGTGFLGRFVVEKLIQNNVAFTVLTRNPQKIELFSKKVPYIIGDLFKYDELELSSYQKFINCSGEINDEGLMQQLHIESVAGILKKLKLIKNAHWIQVSSVGVYGKVHKGTVHEDVPFSPIGTYELTKAEGELLVKEFCSKNNINFTIIRPSNVFGYSMPNQSLLKLITLIKKGVFFYIGKPSTNIMMNYVAVEDVAELIVSCLTNQAALNQDFIISDQISLVEFIDIVCKELNRKNNFYFLPERLVRFLTKYLQFIPGFPINNNRIDALTMQTIYSTDKAKNRLTFSYSTGLARALKNYITHEAVNKWAGKKIPYIHLN